jgi:hypothetical protein
LDVKVNALLVIIGMFAQAVKKICSLEMMGLVGIVQAIVVDAGTLIIATIAMKDFIQLRKDGVTGAVKGVLIVVLILALNAILGTLMIMGFVSNAKLIAKSAII